MCSINLEYADVWSEIERKASTPKQCVVCLTTIQPGHHYVKHFSKFDGSITSNAVCKLCEADREIFAKAHHNMLPNPANFFELLKECVSDEDDDEWQPMLDRIKKRAAV